MPVIICSSCGHPRDTKRCYELYVGLGNCQFICLSCQKLPFWRVMDNLKKGKIYVTGMYKTLEELSVNRVKEN